MGSCDQAAYMQSAKNLAGGIHLARRANRGGLFTLLQQERQHPATMLFAGAFTSALQPHCESHEKESFSGSF